MKINFILTLIVITNLFILVRCQKIDNLAKCCDSFSSVFEKNSSFVCQNSTDSRFVLNTSKTEFITTSCVDIFESSITIFEVQDGDLKAPKRKIYAEVFHKCCPVGSFYNHHNRSCDKLDLQSSFQATFISVGLPQCVIIKDYIYPSLELVEKRLKGQDDDHCLDDTLSGEFILRVCQTLDVCQSTMCLRKCCGDGKSFVNGSNCEDTFEKGFYLDHFSNHIENPHCKYKKRVFIYYIWKNYENL